MASLVSSFEDPTRGLQTGHLPLLTGMLSLLAGLNLGRICFPFRLCEGKSSTPRLPIEVDHSLLLKGRMESATEDWDEACLG